MARRPSIKAWFNYEKQNIEDAMYSIILIILVRGISLAGLLVNDRVPPS